MAKKRSQPDPHDRPAKKRRKGEERPSAGDPLGKLVAHYGVNIFESIVVAAIAGLIGGGVIWYAMTRDPLSVLWLITGSSLAIMAVVMLGLGLLNMGRRLELRKRGLRWTEFGSVTEFTWDDIADVEIHRQDETYLGVASVHKRSSDAIRSSGPLTKTEWDVTVHARDGRTIHLKPLFLKTVSDPKKLISQIRMGAGLK